MKINMILMGAVLVLVASCSGKNTKIDPAFLIDINAEERAQIEEIELEIIQLADKKQEVREALIITTSKITISGQKNNLLKMEKPMLDNMLLLFERTRNKPKKSEIQRRKSENADEQILEAHYLNFLEAKTTEQKGRIRMIDAKSSEKIAQKKYLESIVARTYEDKNLPQKKEKIDSNVFKSIWSEKRKTEIQILKDRESTIDRLILLARKLDNSRYDSQSLIQKLEADEIQGQEEIIRLTAPLENQSMPVEKEIEKDEDVTETTIEEDQ